eukprot:TRINITY_DN653_c0_g2_i22.p1 TRINITY_DN653_c0_g2~~TRINITY_DN653_c0_g2_i22.p1  ORF type:complete len:186 (-),score=28.64 TRINITY_DN653_c0_g2_i22:246-803(-)
MLEVIVVLMKRFVDKCGQLDPVLSLVSVPGVPHAYVSKKNLARIKQEIEEDTSKCPVIDDFHSPQQQNSDEEEHSSDDEFSGNGEGKEDVRGHEEDLSTSQNISTLSSHQFQTSRKRQRIESHDGPCIVFNETSQYLDQNQPLYDFPITSYCTPRGSTKKIKLHQDDENEKSLEQASLIADVVRA